MKGVGGSQRIHNPLVGTDRMNIDHLLERCKRLEDECRNQQKEIAALREQLQKQWHSGFAEGVASERQRRRTPGSVTIVG